MSVRTGSPPGGTPQDGMQRGQRPWILDLRGSHPWRSTMGPGPSQSPVWNARLLPQPSASGVLSLMASILETLSPAATHLPTTQSPSAPPGASDNAQSVINLYDQNEVIPILDRPIYPKDGGAHQATTRPSTLLRERSTAPACPGGLLRFRAISGRQQQALGEKGPWAIKGPGPWRAGLSAGLTYAGQFSRAFCPNQRS